MAQARKQSEKEFVLMLISACISAARVAQAKHAAENARRKAESKRIADELRKLKLERQKLNGEISRLKR